MPDLNAITISSIFRLRLQISGFFLKTQFPLSIKLKTWLCTKLYSIIFDNSIAYYNIYLMEIGMIMMMIFSIAIMLMVMMNEIILLIVIMIIK